LVLSFSFAIQGATPWLVEDPLFKIPSGAGYRKKSYWENRVTNFHKTKEGKLLKSAWLTPDKLQKGVGKITAKSRDFLSAWGATGRVDASKHLINLIPTLTMESWLSSAFIGLARSMIPDSHEFIVKNIKYYQIKNSYLRQVFDLIAIKDPTTLIPLLKLPKFAVLASDSMRRVPDLKVEPFLRHAVLLKTLPIGNYLSFVSSVMPFLPSTAKKGVCRFLFNRLPLPSSGSIGNSSTYIRILSHCTGSINDPRWLALLGREGVKLVVLKSMRKQNHFDYPKLFSQPARDLMTEYTGSPGWERLLLSVLGKIRDVKSIKKVASYVLSPNLWLREEALTSLAFGTDPVSGRMLHAAALESAGEEAVEYFIPYIYNVKNKKWGPKSIKALEGVALKYLRAKDQSYKRAALFVLANLPSGKYQSKWWPEAVKFINKFKEKKSYDFIAGFLPQISNHKTGVVVLRSALYNNNAMVRAGAAFSLGLANDKKSIKSLYNLSKTVSKKVAVNASWALGQIKGSDSYLKLLLNSFHKEVVGNVATALMRREYSIKGKGKQCNAIFKVVKNRSANPIVIGQALVWLRKKCSHMNKSNLFRWAATHPYFIITPLFKSGNLPYHEQFGKKGPFFLRLLNRYHIGKEGKPYKLKFPSGEIVYGWTTFGGVVFHSSLPKNGVSVEFLK
jgi:hypothetical protein